MNKLFSSFKNIDIFGHRVDLYLEKKNTVKSHFGAIVTFFIIGICLYMFILNIFAWSNLNNLQIIPSSISLSPTEIISQNKSLEYKFDYQNYNIYFALFSVGVDGTVLTSQRLERYFKQKIGYWDRKSVYSELEFEFCNKSKIDSFLNLEQELINNDINKTNSALICVKDPFTMGLFPEKQYVYNPSLLYSVSKCKNTTQNNFSCATEQEIKNILSYVHIQISAPKTIFDFTQTSMPKKRTYDTQFQGIQYDVHQTLIASLYATYVNTDHGLLSEYYQPDSLDFNVEKIVYQNSMRNPDDDVLFDFTIQMAYSQQIYYRKNIKIKDILSSLGGILNLLVLLGKIVCDNYNSIIYINRVMEKSFTKIGNK